MIILDTDVFSTLMKPAREPKVIAWIDRQRAASIWTTSITVLEIRYGLELMPPGRRRTDLAEAFEIVLQGMDRRVVPLDFECGARAGELMALRFKTGRPGELRDTMIAGIVLAHNATLATRNTAHFADIAATVVNPWTV